MKNLILAMGVFLFITVLLPCNVYSYLDPGTGSYVLQLLAAALFGSVFVLKMFWARVKRFFTGLFSKRHIDEDK